MHDSSLKESSCQNRGAMMNWLEYEDDPGDPISSWFVPILPSYFSFQPVLHDWCNKGRGMCYPVCGMVHIKEPLLLIDE